MKFCTIHSILSVAMPGLCAFTLIVATKSEAQVVIVNNLSQTVEGTDISGINAAGQEFITGNTALQLASVTVPLEGATSNTLDLALYSDNGSDSPGISLLNLGTAVPTSTTSFTDITVTPASSVTLAANTAYWIVGEYAFTVSTPSPGPWAYANPDLSSTGVGTIGPNYAYSSDGGATWATSSAATDGPYIFEVQGSSSVPEPGIYALLGSMGLIGAAFLRRSRNLSKAT